MTKTAWVMISAFAAAGALALVGLNLTIPQRVADARSQSANPPMEETKQVQTVPETAKTLVLGGGCFWCVEAIFEDLIGVYKVENGFAGGNDPNPTYEKVVSGRTGAAEVVKIWYDEKQISRDDLLRFFFTTHDPTTLNRQGNDVGTQYRSVIFYEGEEDKALAGRIKEEVSKEKIWPDPIVTTLEPLAHYTTAEEYHQNYFAKYEKASAFERMKMNAGYCQFVIEPKVRKFREKFRDRLRRKSD